MERGRKRRREGDTGWGLSCWTWSKHHVFFISLFFLLINKMHKVFSKASIIVFFLASRNKKSYSNAAFLYVMLALSQLLYKSHGSSAHLRYWFTGDNTLNYRSKSKHHQLMSCSLCKILIVYYNECFIQWGFMRGFQVSTFTD